MAANAQESLPVDELEDIVCLIKEGLLEDDDQLNEQIQEIVRAVDLDETNHAGFKCSGCGKMCKSQRGLKRHSSSKQGDISSSGLTVSPLTASKSYSSSSSSSSSTGNFIHPSSSSSSSSGNFIHQKLHPLQLKAIVLKCAEKISKEECFPLRLREFFFKGSFFFTNDDAVALLSQLRNVAYGYSGDAEKFYSNFFLYLLSMFFHWSLRTPS